MIKGAAGNTELLTVFLGDLEGVPGTLEVGAGDDQFLTPDLFRPRDDSTEVVRVPLGAVVDSPEYRVCEVDADLAMPDERVSELTDLTKRGRSEV